MAESETVKRLFFRKRDCCSGDNGEEASDSKLDATATRGEREGRDEAGAGVEGPVTSSRDLTAAAAIIQRVIALLAPGT
jgi:hypothetical protein